MRKFSLTVLIERDEDGIFIAKVPAIKGCYTQAPSYEDLIPRIREAIDLCLEVSGVEAIPKLNELCCRKTVNNILLIINMRFFQGKGYRVEEHSLNLFFSGFYPLP